MFTISVAMINVLGASPFEAGLAAPLGSAGPLLFGLFAGVLVDRWGQRRTMLGATWVRMLAYGWAVAAFALGWLAAWQMLVVILVISVADVFSMAAHTSVLPKVVGRDRVSDAVSSLMATDQVLALTAPALGGQLVRLLPAPIVLAVSAIGQGIAGFGLRKLPPDAVPVEGKPRIPMGEAIRDGLRFMTQHQLLLALMLTTATNNAAAGVYTAAQSWFVLKDLRMPPELFGLVWSISAIGGIGSAEDLETDRPASGRLLRFAMDACELRTHPAHRSGPTPCIHHDHYDFHHLWLRRQRLHRQLHLHRHRTHT